MRLVLLGSPVSHSRSPAIHVAALAALGIEGTYRVRDVGTVGLDAAVAELRAGDLDGANVTMPHKEAAAVRCDLLAGAAERLGAVNTLVMGGDGLLGANTDAPGIVDVWARRHLPTSSPVLVLGGGGAARAALVALEGRDLAVSTRRAGAGVGTAASVASTAREVRWGEPVPGAVVVNATPLGMAGEELPAGVVEAASGLLDMPYGDRPTPAVVEAQGRGIPTADGVDLLVAQAGHSFRIWTGRDAPLEVMEAAARSTTA